ncbi:MAG: hypothetical protein PHR84_01295 [Candidatus Omnitrophica bacterium]|jgi:hypothetical protein|nr:hypothetical protein [Candidatus Omnitrophota bacterium]MDD5660566.1 hypothetical protein [Candidatus Omnitrophota bacterium]
MGQEEKKCCGTEDKCCDAKKTMSMIFKVILGLALLVLGGWLTLTFWESLLMIIKGGIGLFLILAGVITLAIAKE